MTVHYTKEEMVFMDYQWESRYHNENPEERGVPGYTFLNRWEGYEILYFINRCTYVWNWGKERIHAYQNLERILRDGIPCFVRTHEEVRRFIEKQYPRL